ncbi:MAG: hypothetical protein Q4G24_12645 [Paracoccus sp. (in: a-proteobacteria)]|uniref:hypothetical protein n=1 Tax=Paracoccus sp. TaxID=267 RepID=UPI0026DF4119|nr:hypothetical protein [Paracoccus sp. (in: a-proteobacteria)]MDO5622307.1 hypothetical protein [Paracoccus sp. (in: a-proteobacteria)]
MVTGWVRIKASGVIAKGDAVMTAATGGVKKALTTSKNICGTALIAAADGEFVDILIR